MTLYGYAGGLGAGGEGRKGTKWVQVQMSKRNNGIVAPC